MQTRGRPIKKINYTPVQPYALKAPMKTPADWYYALRRFYLWHVRYFHRDLQYGFRNLFRWFYAIWVDRDWDQHYLWEMTLKKMKYMQHDIRVNVMEGDHQKALDRAVILLGELIKQKLSG